MNGHFDDERFQSAQCRTQSPVGDLTSEDWFSISEITVTLDKKRGRSRGLRLLQQQELSRLILTLAFEDFRSLPVPSSGWWVSGLPHKSLTLNLRCLQLAPALLLIGIWLFRFWRINFGECVDRYFNLDVDEH